MKTKDLTPILNGLLGPGVPGGGAAPTGGFGGGYGGNGLISNEDSIPVELQGQEPIFEINYKSEKKQSIKKAKDQLKIMVAGIVPEQYRNMSAITDKIDQDAEQIGNLYYIYKTKEVTYQALLDTIARGETQPRMFEASERMAKSLEDQSTKITETLNAMRKAYIDIYLDIQTKIDAEEVAQSNGIAAISNNTAAPVAIGNDTAPKAITSGGEKFVGTDSLLEYMKDRKKQKYKQAKQNALDAVQVESSR